MEAENLLRKLEIIQKAETGIEFGTNLRDYKYSFEQVCSIIKEIEKKAEIFDLAEEFQIKSKELKILNDKILEKRKKIEK